MDKLPIFTGMYFGYKIQNAAYIQQNTKNNFLRKKVITANK